MEITALQVSCTLLQGFNADSSFFGLTEHSWTFYTTIGSDEIFFATIKLQLCLYPPTIINADEDVYSIYAEISFNPKTNMLFDLR